MIMWYFIEVHPIRHLVQTVPAWLPVVAAVVVAAAEPVKVVAAIRRVAPVDGLAVVAAVVVVASSLTYPLLLEATVVAAELTLTLQYPPASRAQLSTPNSRETIEQGVRLTCELT
jgi:hypothetical protein